MNQKVDYTVLPANSFSFETRGKSDVMTRICGRSIFAGAKKKTDSVLLKEENSNVMSGLSAIEAAIEVKLVSADLGGIYPDIEGTVNGIYSHFLPERLGAKLNEGDMLGISFITMGGR